MNNHTNQSQLTNDADIALYSITVTMTNQSDVLQQIFTVYSQLKYDCRITTCKKKLRPL